MHRRPSVSSMMFKHWDFRGIGIFKALGFQGIDDPRSLMIVQA
jgi:hypothetical protein